MEIRWVKARLLGGELPLYDTLDATEPSEQFSGDSVVEVDAAKQGENRHQIILPDGRRKYISAEGLNVLHKVSLWKVAQFVVKVFTQPDASSPVIATLSYGDSFEQVGQVTQLNGREWIPLGLRDGRSGYIDRDRGRLKIVLRGIQVRIEDDSTHQSRQWVDKDHKLVPFDDWSRTPRQDAVYYMKIGGICCGIGLVVIIGAMFAGCDKDYCCSGVILWACAIYNGFLYVIFWGMVLCGGICFLSGVHDYLKVLRNAKIN